LEKKRVEVLAMPEDIPTKVCPYCAETIAATVKVCPHCRSWQKKWSLNNPQVATATSLIIILSVFVILFAVVLRAFGPKQQFAVYRDQIGVLASEFNEHVVESNLVVTVVGTITNRSDIGWKNVCVEAQFFDQSGRLIDAIPVSEEWYRGVVILPHGEAAFKIEGKASHPAGDYYTNQLAVRWAKDEDQMLP
jgi:hypothetical protein